MNKLFSLLLYLIVIIGIVALGLLAINQFIKFRYNNEILANPCNLCVKLNPEWLECYKKITQPKVVTTPMKELNISNFKIPKQDS